MPQSARLSEGGWVQSLFGQCPNRPGIFLSGASLTTLGLVSTARSSLRTGAPLQVDWQPIFKLLTYFFNFTFLISCYGLRSKQKCLYSTVTFTIFHFTFEAAGVRMTDTFLHFTLDSSVNSIRRDAPFNENRRQV